MSTRHISFPIGMTPVQSIMTWIQQNSHLIYRNPYILPSINYIDMIPRIVMHWQHKYYNIFDGHYHILSTDHEIIPNLKTNHSKHIRWSCCPSMWCSLYEKRRSVVMWSHKIQHKQPTSYVASDFKIEAPFISYFCSSCFIPCRMLI